jgi:hypothetical protein
MRCFLKRPVKRRLSGRYNYMGDDHRIGRVQSRRLPCVAGCIKFFKGTQLKENHHAGVWCREGELNSQKTDLQSAALAALPSLRLHNVKRNLVYSRFCNIYVSEIKGYISI